MKTQDFIKVRATSQNIHDTNDTNEVQFYLNVSTIKIITLGGEIHLTDNGNDTRDGFLWNGDLRFTNIRIHEDINLEDLLN
ncbi:hypothetical protein [Prolixibacter denitrificans]|uniref:Uncharacterized protein n=1 Tax=Prolixibacter denitrificans TaxID=1541063 RepID=A0A2P8CE69_9BACT|nr:hypothetical protein [Prolixibacter denitrificans]PSK83260.1 hypothetical protein CLV93_104190 [Prolixibacter denitrificans]GET21857.1 hypothetical protein JCM18694_21030 [Prolixibacter denitrificans]